MILLKKVFKRNNLFQKQKFDKSYENIKFDILNFQGFKNSSEINEFCQKNQKIDDENIKEFLKLAQSQEKIHLFKINTFSRLCFQTSRFQIFFYCVFSTIYSLFLVHYKYNQVKDKKGKKAAATRKKCIVTSVSLVTTSLLAIILTRFMSKRMIKSIYFLPKENKITINYFSKICRDRPYTIGLNEIQILKQKRKWDSTIEYELINQKSDYHKFISTHGTGNFIKKGILDQLLQHNLKQ